MWPRLTRRGTRWQTLLHLDVTPRKQACYVGTSPDSSPCHSSRAWDASGRWSRGIARNGGRPSLSKRYNAILARRGPSDFSRLGLPTFLMCIRQRTPTSGRRGDQSTALVPLLLCSASASLALSTCPPQGDPAMSKARCRPAANLHRRLRGPRRLDWQSGRQRYTPPIVTVGFLPPILKPFGLRQRKTVKLNVKVSSPSGPDGQSQAW
jgi:hypothetical protein